MKLATETQNYREKKRQAALESEFAFVWSTAFRRPPEGGTPNTSLALNLSSPL